MRAGPLAGQQRRAGMNKRGCLRDARRAHNTKAGAPDNQFGVKLGDIRAMAKKIKTYHERALNLWDTGNVEAQLLATLIIKPKSLSADDLDKLTRSTTCGQVADWLNAYVVAQHTEKEALREHDPRLHGVGCYRVKPSKVSEEHISGFAV